MLFLPDIARHGMSSAPDGVCIPVRRVYASANRQLRLQNFRDGAASPVPRGVHLLLIAYGRSVDDAGVGSTLQKSRVI